MRRREVAERLLILEDRLAYLFKIMGISAEDRFSAIDMDSFTDDGETHADARSRIAKELSDLNNRLMGVGAPLTTQERERLSLLQRIDWSGASS